MKKRRKLTQEKVDAINRKRMFLNGEGTLESPGEKLVLDFRKRAIVIDESTIVPWAGVGLKCS
jgi:hypothetical protein